MGPVSFIFTLFIVAVVVFLLAVAGLMCRMVSGSKGGNGNIKTVNTCKEKRAP